MKIDHSRDFLLTEFGKETLKDRYMVPGESSPQEAFARAAKAFADDDEHAQRMYNYASNLWMMFSTPILSNGGTTRGLPISCYLSTVSDTRSGIMDHMRENMFLASMGGGIGSTIGDLRSDGMGTSSGSQSNGTIPFLKVFDSLIGAVSQGKSRRGSYASYQNISHPEIEEFIEIRKPTGGDINRKALNIHNAVNLTDDFMEAVVQGRGWNLVDPHTKEVTKVVDARGLWQKVLETRMVTGEPYIHYIDTSNKYLPKTQKSLGLAITTSNLCVAPETKILTKNGHVPIVDLVDQEVEVWNGKEWSRTIVRKTSDNSKLIKVVLSDGSYLECTEYHKFHIQKGYNRGSGKNKLELIEKSASELAVGDKLIKFNVPIIDFSEKMPDAYTQGFFTGDGCRYQDKNHIDLYGEKINLKKYLKFNREDKYSESQNRQRVYIDNNYLKFVVPHNTSIESRVEWLSGLFDADGVLCSHQTDNTTALQLSSINFDFLFEVKLLLQTLGIQSKITKLHGERSALLPDGRGGRKLYDCKSVWRILINSTSLNTLIDLGFNTHRLKIYKHNSNRDARHFVKVKGIVDTGRESPTYCFNEPKEHKGVFNGILTGQCSEIILPVDSQRTAVCCLSSVNLEKFDEWKDNDLFIEDIVRFLDNVLSVFIKEAPGELSKAVYSASQERSIGLGAMGFHSYLQKNNIPFEGPLASGINRKLFNHIHERAIAATEKLAEERGSCPDALGDKRRNMHVIAIAPNASSSIICGGTSPSIEPIRANAYTHKTMSGSFLVKNKFLEGLLESYGKNTEEIWTSIITNKGSVQHLDFLSDWEKDVFKTAIEIDQRWIIEHAGSRQPYICQSQSVNLFFAPDTSVKYLNDVHLLAWKRGLKTLYYLRSEAAYKPKAITEKIERVVRKDSEEECWSCQG